MRERMNLVELQQKLIASARSHPPGDTVPLGFEHRILARLRAEHPLDFWSGLAATLWRLAVPGLAAALVLGVWNYAIVVKGGAEVSLAADLESTVYAVVDAPAETL